ncbi:prepilin-type N-terminal cleavage/methylation domain-containing protein [Phycisphaerales bacterium AB-hyl4]|uniref:Prepilin-type N-terminal cleavage/methylation domain-containing protein n=1 Tax=Natronomicrosphaera hydrolytica TaxID=3242702 RepID=A0ABV4U5F8_9BACT
MINLRNKNQCRRGFTLIELLVVITIIALMISLLLPALNSARSTAQLMKSSSNQRQIMLALTMYTQDYGRLPYGYQDEDLNALPGTFAAWTRVITYFGYVSSDEVFFSPATDYGFSYNRDPSEQVYSPWAYPSYGVNSQGAMPQYNPTNTRRGASLDDASSVTSLSNFLILRHVWNAAYPERDYGWYRWFRFNPMHPPANAYYGNRVAATYADGHVQTMSTDEMRDITFGNDHEKGPFWENQFTQ